MYIWVILATFLAMLASYSLAVRPDMRAVVVEPVAEGVLGKLVVQHKAAVNYARYNKFPYAAERNRVEFAPGIIDAGSLEAELPFGYYLSGEYTSQIFCMNSNMTVSYDYLGGGENPCDVRGNRRILVTYGPIPSRWMSLSSSMERPNMDFMNAMRRIVNVGEQLGYTAPADAADAAASVDNPSASNVRLVDRNGSYNVFVPKAIVQDADFMDVCDLSKNFACLVYMSSI